jgi:hypothetical protein
MNCACGELGEGGTHARNGNRRCFAGVPSAIEEAVFKAVFFIASIEKLRFLSSVRRFIVFTNDACPRRNDRRD